MNQKEDKSILILLTRLVTLTLLISISPLTGNLLASQQPEPEKAYRLAIKYQNGEMELLNVESLQMVIPLTVKEQIMKEEDQPTGYFFEILDDEKNVVLRSNMHDPTVTLLEYEDPEHPGRLKSELVKHDEITFSIITPAPAQARFVHFARIEKKEREDLGIFDLAQGSKKTH